MSVQRSAPKSTTLMNNSGGACRRGRQECDSQRCSVLQQVVALLQRAATCRCTVAACCNMSLLGGACMVAYSCSTVPSHESPHASAAKTVRSRVTRAAGSAICTVPSANSTPFAEAAHARTHAHTHARTHTRTNAHTPTPTPTPTPTRTHRSTEKQDPMPSARVRGSFGLVNGPSTCDARVRGATRKGKGVHACM